MEVSQNPNARMIHFDDDRNPFRCSQPQNWNCGWIRDWISVERDDLEGMARQGKTADLGRAPVENMKENPFALFHADRVTVAEHAPIDSE
jgi:hypothetical protein